jgi:serine phosphatase RsbU (regulator of sigma subunit)
MTSKSNSATPEPEIIGTIREDLRRNDLGKTLRRDFRELREYMLDEESQKRLKEMRVVKRWIVLAWWLLKSMFFKLTPVRRIILVAGIVLVVLSRTAIYVDEHIQIQPDTNAIGVLAILFVLMLELKDKLVAHDELQAGRDVQRALMPDQKPRVDGWDLWLFTRSANEVGGDLVDFMRISDERIGIALGDVAGKGLSAALLASKLQATVRALASDVPSPAVLGSKLNQIFWRDTPRNIFASLVYIEFSPDSGRVRFLNAGHLPPMILRGKIVEKTGKGAVALGIMPELNPDERQVDLARGDMLLVYSDGLTEARDEAGIFFGDQRLLDLLPGFDGLDAEQTGSGLVAEVDRFVGDGKMHDDLSIVLLRKV